MYRLTYTPAALRYLRKLDRHIAADVFAAIELLSADPRPRGIEKLTGHGKLYRIALGPGKNYRAIYEIHDQALVVLIIRVGDRKEVYRLLG
jgi:mRNA interferase RelE/StbE